MRTYHMYKLIAIIFRIAGFLGVFTDSIIGGFGVGEFLVTSYQLPVLIFLVTGNW